MITDLGHTDAFDDLAMSEAGETVIIIVRQPKTDAVGGVRLKLLMVGDNHVEGVDGTGRQWMLHRGGSAYCTDGVELCNVLVDFGSPWGDE